MQFKPSAQFYVLLTVLIWSFFGVISKLLADVKIDVVVTISLWASSLFNYVYARRVKTNKAVFLKKLSWIITSLFGYSIYWIFYISCIESYSNISIPVILNYTWPLFTGVLTIIIYQRQHFNLSFVLTVVLGLFGIILLQSEGQLSSLKFSESYWGLFMGVLCGISYGYYSAKSSGLEKDELPSYLFTGTFISSIVMTIFVFIRNGLEAFELSAYEWGLALFIGLVFDTSGYIFWTKAQAQAVIEKTDITKLVGLANYLPVFSILALAIFYDDERTIILQPYFLISMIVILLASLIPGLNKSSHIEG